MCRHEEGRKRERQEGGERQVHDRRVYWPQACALCPVFLHLLQTHTRFVDGGLELSAVEEAAAHDDAVPHDEVALVEQGGTGEDGTAGEERRVSGCGQTLSCISSR